MRTAVVVFPGTNCEYETLHVLAHRMEQPTQIVWHKETTLEGFDVVILPGGFAHGDYLRAGAIARFSPIMTAVARHAKRGGIVVGICNGFQMLTEAGLLPGALMRNTGVSFLSRDVWLRVENADTPLTMACEKGRILRMPIGHGEGNFVAEPGVLDRLEAEGRVVFRYVAPPERGGEADPRFNVNGSARGIAGIMNESGNVLGLMPHPERDAESLLGAGEGILVFESLVRAVSRAAA